MNLPITALALFSSFVWNSTIYFYKPNYIDSCYATISWNTDLNETWPYTWTKMGNVNNFCAKDVDFKQTTNSLFAYKINYLLHNRTNLTSEWKFGVTDKLNIQQFKDLIIYETYKKSTLYLLIKYVSVTVITTVTIFSIILIILLITKKIKKW
jgi:hypothetical protein